MVNLEMESSLVDGAFWAFASSSFGVTAQLRRQRGQKFLSPAGYSIGWLTAKRKRFHTTTHNANPSFRGALGGSIVGLSRGVSQRNIFRN